MSFVVDRNLSFVAFRKCREVAQALRSLKVFVGLDEQFAMTAGDVVIFPVAGTVEEYVYFEGTNIISDLGFASYTHSDCSDVRVGRYCSIAHGLQIMGMRHPIERMTSSGLTYDLAKPHYRAIYEDYFLNHDLISYPPKPLLGVGPLVENDVWIGTNVTLARGIRLGNGCVVAANSVVTKDVPPYAIVGGNPAKIIRYRFDEDTIAGLLEIAWWNFHPVIIASDLRSDPVQMLKRVRAGGYFEHAFRKVTINDILIALGETTEVVPEIWTGG
jgi:acetyltransferase-like isoleucine patch superfamily enzyme